MKKLLSLLIIINICVNYVHFVGYSYMNVRTSQVQNLQIMKKIASKKIYNETKLQEIKTSLKKKKYRAKIKREGVNFKVTFYTLSVTSCGKSRNHPQYGLTRTGFSLKGKDWNTARTIAADPNVLPMGTKVYILFSGKLQYLSGYYTVRDTGSGVKGNHIDFFLGEFSDKLAYQYGVKNAKIKVCN